MPTAVVAVANGSLRQLLRHLAWPQGRLSVVLESWSPLGSGRTVSTVSLGPFAGTARPAAYRETSMPQSVWPLLLTAAIPAPTPAPVAIICPIACHVASAAPVFSSDLVQQALAARGWELAEEGGCSRLFFGFCAGGAGRQRVVTGRGGRLLWQETDDLCPICRATVLERERVSLRTCSLGDICNLYAWL